MKSLVFSVSTTAKFAIATMLLGGAVAASALPRANPTCGQRAKDPQSYDFCMRLSGQQSANPVTQQIPGIQPVIGNEVHPKPESAKLRMSNCIQLVRKQKNMTAADASVFCQNVVNP